MNSAQAVFLKFRPWRSRGARRLLAVLLGGLLSLAGLLMPAGGAGAPLALEAPLAAVDSGVSANTPVPLQRQPFYPQLLATAERWRSAPLSEVAADNPRDTLLNFYVVMAGVDHEVEAIAQLARNDPGPFWSQAARQRIDQVESRFALAVKALDTSVFPESVRSNLADETAMQLKEVLDYVFNHSPVPVVIPDNRELREIGKQLNKSSDAWTWPRTGITLALLKEADQGEPHFLFSKETVLKVQAMHRLVRGFRVAETAYATPGLYTGYVSTPGHLVPPKWYLRLPDRWRQVLEISFAEQTLFQVVLSLLVLLLYGVVLAFLAVYLLRTYRYMRSEKGSGISLLQVDNIAWSRVLLVLPALPLTWLCQVVIDDQINFTGLPLVVIKYAFFILYFIAASLLAFYLFEALGRSLVEWLVRLRGGGGELQIKRVSNLVMPICRVLGALVSLVLIYRLLIALGLPAATILAFSAVPGLAIGLGASKLLGNLFAGLSIQTDRPVRVGEFCRIGANQGFVTRIGLRSLELQTLESRVTIPNAIVDEETIVNYCSRKGDVVGPLRQSLDIRIPVPAGFSPDQIGDLLHFMRVYVQAETDLQEPLLSIDPVTSDDHAIVFSCLVLVSEWGEYLSFRERVLRRFDEICEQVLLSHRKIGVSFSTPSDQLRAIRQMISEVVQSDPMLELKSCRLMALSEYSYDFSIRLHAHHPSHAQVKDAIDRFNQDLIACFAAAGIEIPFPTATHYMVGLRP